MSAETFLDTNVLVYCFDSGEPEKRRRARVLVEEALRDGSAIISTQVTQEFLNLATRKFAKTLVGDDLRAYLDGVTGASLQGVPDSALFRLALEIQSETGYSFYDSLIVAGALKGGCCASFLRGFAAGARNPGNDYRESFPRFECGK